MTLKICKLILTDEVNCQFQNLNQDILEYFYEEYRYMVPGARFMPKVQLGMWDGYISFFSKSGKTFIYLLPKIIKDIISLGIKIDVSDNRPKCDIKFNKLDINRYSHVLHPESNLPIIIRDYQYEGITALIKKMGGILTAGTGGGKTLIIATLCDLHIEQGLKCIVIVPDSGLVDQTKSFFIHLGLNTGEFSGKSKDIDHDVVISTWQTIQNAKIIMEQFDMVLVDECHVVKGAQLKDILGKAGRKIKFRYGVTATMPKEKIDKLTILTALGDVQYEISAIDLIDKGHLAGLHIEIQQSCENLEKQYNIHKKSFPNSDLSYTRFKNSYFMDYSSEKTHIRTYKPRVQWIVDKLKELQKHGNVFCLIDSKPLGRNLLKKINNENAYFVSGDDDIKDRQKIYDLFRDNNNLIVIATVHCAGRGLDISRIFNLVLVDLGKSFIRILQSIGRGLRKAKDKDFVDVLDICCDLKYGKRHLAERVKFYKDAKYPYTKNKFKYE